MSGQATPNAHLAELATVRHGGGGGGGGGRRLVLVHGFTQTARSWDRIARRLAPRYDVVAVDAPGHGGSSDIDADLVRGARLLGHAGGRATYVGYSMGGRLALRLALDHPALVQALVLLGASPGIEDVAERADRRRADDELAASIERDGVERFLDLWLARPLFATLPRAAADVDDRRRNTARGLAASVRAAGTGSQDPLWDRLGELSMPVLLVTGELDAKFAAIAERMAGRIADATVAAIAGAGHSAHLEQPEAFADIVDRWSSYAPSTNPSEARAP